MTRGPHEARDTLPLLWRGWRASRLSVRTGSRFGCVRVQHEPTGQVRVARRRRGSHPGPQHHFAANTGQWHPRPPHADRTRLAVGRQKLWAPADFGRRNSSTRPRYCRPCLWRVKDGWYPCGSCCSKHRMGLRVAHQLVRVTRRLAARASKPKRATAQHGTPCAPDEYCRWKALGRTADACAAVGARDGTAPRPKSSSGQSRQHSLSTARKAQGVGWGGGV
jgi:hypothetical protein